MANTILYLGIGAAALGAVYLYEQSVVSKTGTPPGVPDTISPKVPKDINRLMINAWTAAGKPGQYLSSGGEGRDAWVRTVLPLLPGVMDYGKWGLIYDQAEGYFSRYGTWANDDQVYQWVVAAAGTS